MGECLRAHGGRPRLPSGVLPRRRCLVMPLWRAGEWWCLWLSSSRYGLTKKTGANNDSVVGDATEPVRMKGLLSEMKTCGRLQGYRTLQEAQKRKWQPTTNVVRKKQAARLPGENEEPLKRRRRHLERSVGNLEPRFLCGRPVPAPAGAARLCLTFLVATAA